MRSKAFSERVTACTRCGRHSCICKLARATILFIVISIICLSLASLTFLFQTLIEQ